MEKNYDFDNINWNDLRNQKHTLLSLIENEALRGVMNHVGDDLQSIVHLIDSLQDHVVDNLGYNPNEVYLLDEPDPDFPPDPLSKLVVTEEAKAIVQNIMAKAIYSTPTKTVYLCPNCGSDNVELKHWVNPNNGKVGTDCKEDGYCNDCDQYGELLVTELKYLAEVIGFQVVNEDGDIHPDMAGSFCVYSLSQAKEMLEDDNAQWRLLTIWTGDIEHPTIMYTKGVRM
jgi:hypothetical protein